MLDKIKVGGIVYDVEFKELEADQGVQLGWCKRAQTLIEVNNHNISKQLQQQTLIHEMTHAILFEAGLELENEEDAVNRIALVLHQVLKDNDFGWLREGSEITQTVIAGGKTYLMDEKGKLVEL